MPLLDKLRMLGAHRCPMDGVEGVRFSVWAPNARRVSVVGDFNDWDGSRDPMLRGDGGIWERFVAAVADGAFYKYEIESMTGEVLLKADPFARYGEPRAHYASIVWSDGSWAWSDAAWLRRRAARHDRRAPISIYEVHLGSWRRRDGRPLSYRELAAELLPYVADMGFTHVELLPLTEHPHDPSWGYQPTGLFAPTGRYGTPDDFRAFVDHAHALELGVILDWVPGHFPNDPHGLAHFDGTPLFEDADAQRGVQPEWKTLVYDYAKPEVASLLIASALYWIEAFHVDALRVDAVASLLYLDYNRAAGQWRPNVNGGNENLEAVAFFRRLNETLARQHPDVATFAEDSSAWPMVTAPADAGGLGFGFKWNMAWRHELFTFFETAVDAANRYELLARSADQLFGEAYVLPLSHDEVVHGKGSLLEKMRGDRAQRFANLRLLLGLLYATPGKKLLFMGDEFGAAREWDCDAELEWRLLDDPLHAGIQHLVRDCNAIYRRFPALHARDGDPLSFAWIKSPADGDGRFAFVRTNAVGDDRVIVAVNATASHPWRFEAPCAAGYRLLLDTSAPRYGGPEPDGCEAALTLPPLCLVILGAP